MAKHCPPCAYDTDDDWSDECPICGKPLLTDEEKAKGWDRMAGNPGVWGRRYTKVQKIYFVIWVAFAVVAIVYFGRLLLML